MDARLVADDPQEMLGLLSREERDRAQAMVTEVRGRFIRHRAGLRRILANYIGLDPHHVELGSGRWGKPSLKGAQARALKFNLSHTGDLAVLAICRGWDVGIDIEDTAAGWRHERLASRVLSPDERRQFGCVAEDARASAFLRNWTCKEAYLKATGQGLSVPLKEISVGFGQPGLLARERAAREGDYLLSWHFHELAPWPGIIGTLAINVPDADLRWFDLLEDLPAIEAMR